VKKSKRNTRKKLGRPVTTGSGRAMMVRMHWPQIHALDAWIGKTRISRPEAIRQLVTWALSDRNP
jgi:hypothetical protein